MGADRFIYPLTLFLTASIIVATISPFKLEELLQKNAYNSIITNNKKKQHLATTKQDQIEHHFDTKCLMNGNM